MRRITVSEDYTISSRELRAVARQWEQRGHCDFFSHLVACVNTGRVLGHRLDKVGCTPDITRLLLGMGFAACWLSDHERKQPH